MLFSWVKIDRLDKKSPKKFSLSRDFCSRKQCTSHGAIVWKNYFLGAYVEFKILTSCTCHVLESPGVLNKEI